MTPAPRKKNSHKRETGDNQQTCKKNFKSNSETNVIENKDTVSIQEICSDTSKEGKKYAKRTVESNWFKYEEPVINPLADQMRGVDFEVALSYSGGSESQLQLQNEKDWDDINSYEKYVAIDFQDLALAIKCIPFHKRFNLPEDIFNEQQISCFCASAAGSRKLYKTNLSNVEKNPVEIQPVESQNLIESCEAEEIEDNITRPFTIEEKTGSMLESLASTLSLKNWAQDKTDNINIKPKEETPKAADDLDFLLSLSITPKSVVNDEKVIEKKSPNVDDWLNSILDD
ncbi:Cell death regulator Aven, partial [Stegodyphus mimosarum]